MYTADKPADGTGWCACLLNAPAATATITLEQSWDVKNKAVYLFAPSAPDDAAKFIQNLDTLLQSLSSFSNAFLWIANSNAVTKTSTSYTLVQQSPNLQRYTSNNTNLLFGKYINLAVPSGCFIQLSGKKLFFELRSQPGSTIRFSSQVAVSKSQIADDRIYISVTGASSGCIRFGLRFNGASDWKSFDADPRLFYGTPAAANALKFPLLDAGFTSLLAFQASLDPNNQLNNNGVPRTFLAFDTAGPVLTTYLRSSFGNALSLAPYVNFLPDENPLPYAVPGSGAAMLVFSPADKGNTGPNYLLPKGGFHLIAGTALAQPTVLNLLCGLSGLETLSFIPERQLTPATCCYSRTNSPRTCKGTR
ncbi:hypothetical protein [Hymenobacter cellulosilyticus]|uniref:Uncharacterized protein n=1 Tax=Hymenobacter cellulosilyticus TaxID=2932248 RepID=A0A8T9PZL2_9BACT|nr:hypothetical protein [Hymenobacter cellulosilyticus]UOQ70185.1 hypothetical protein MUN79_15610 [Hymenobacter cellulosilyticus]